MEVRPMTDHTGAEVRGIDLSRPVDDGDEGRPQPRLRRASRAGDPRPASRADAGAGRGRAVRRGLPAAQHAFALPECPQIHYLSNQDSFPDGRRYIPGEGWHTDHSNDTRPPKATVLHAVTLPSSGGDTQFANMAAAYAALPDATQARIDDLMAIHVYQSSHSARKLMSLARPTRSGCPTRCCIRSCAPIPRAAASRSTSTRSASRASSASTTRRRCRCCTSCSSTPRRSASSIATLWQPGDLVMWDNRCLLHKANGDYDMNETRYLYRVMLQGDVPR